jgi:hypothetical protein
MRITTKLTISMVTGVVLECEAYEYEGPVELACGATASQVADEKAQQSLMTQLTQQSQEEFGSASSVFKDLNDTFAPIVAAGPNQQGFSAPEKAVLDSSAIANTGQAYRNASTAVKESNAAVGGGNIALPSGAEIGRNIEVANAGAAHTSDALNKIDQANYETGRDNYFRAAAGLEQAPSVLSTSNQAGGVAVDSGKAASDTANQIAQADNSWESAVIGGLSGIAGSVATGGMSNLAKGVGFFAQNAPRPGGEKKNDNKQNRTDGRAT